jgi:hypothetical protein
LESFNLGSVTDLNPLQPEGVVGQLHAANLLGMLEVVMEEVVKEAEALREAEPDADKRVKGGSSSQHVRASCPVFCRAASVGAKFGRAAADGANTITALV